MLRWIGPILQTDNIVVWLFVWQILIQTHLFWLGEEDGIEFLKQYQREKTISQKAQQNQQLLTPTAHWSLIVNCDFVRAASYQLNPTGPYLPNLTIFQSYFLGGNFCLLIVQLVSKKILLNSLRV